nr:MAG TPA: hypothetical protein [Caudoviricetes sp.]
MQRIDISYLSDIGDTIWIDFSLLNRVRIG